MSGRGGRRPAQSARRARAVDISASKGKVACNICGVKMSPLGMGFHLKSCREDLDAQVKELQQQAKKLQSIVAEREQERESKRSNMRIRDTESSPVRSAADAPNNGGCEEASGGIHTGEEIYDVERQEPWDRGDEVLQVDGASREGNPEDEQVLAGDQVRARDSEEDTMHEVSAPRCAALPPVVSDNEGDSVLGVQTPQHGGFSGPFVPEVYDRAHALRLSPHEFASLQVGDIKCVYHPYSGKPYEIIRAADYQSSKLPSDRERIMSTNPHRGFNTRDDFELAEFMLDAGLNTPLITRLFNILNKIFQGKSSITLRSADALKSAWDTAAGSEVPFVEKHVDVPYQDQNHTFQVLQRNPWEHVLHQLRDPLLARHIHYDAVRNFRYDGTKFVRVITEPWTADRMWDLQSALKDGAKPIMLILYSDTAKWSTFGTQKARPLMLGILNIDSALRNSNGLGSATIVGWLPIIPKNAQEEGKTRWADFKCDCWHRSAEVILEPLFEPSETNHAVKCGDSELRLVAIRVPVWATDYEEALAVTANRGLNGKSPCPVCLVKPAQLTDVSQEYELRTESDAKLAVEGVYATKAAREAVLKPLGLRNIRNALWKFTDSDVYQAISFDRLHAYHLGLFSKHLFALWKGEIAMAGTAAARSIAVKVDTQVESMPRWPNFHHFSSITTMSFNDGSKFEDISKIIVLASHNAFTEEEYPIGYAILKCMRKFQVLDMYMSYRAHTQASLVSLHNALLAWNTELQVLVDHFLDKDWGFIKAHSHSHAPTDFINKGVAAQFNTKPFEHRHKMTRDIYLHMTNFKNATPQVSKIEHKQLVKISYREHIDQQDAIMLEEMAQDPEESVPKDELWRFAHVYVASRLLVTFKDVEKDHANDPAFGRFRVKCGYRVSGVIAALEREQRAGQPPGRGRIAPSVQVHFSPNDTLVRCHALRVAYTCKITFKAEENILRCSPKFYNAPRYDGILYRKDNGQDAFAKLVYITTHDVQGVRYGLALIHPLDGNLGPRRQKDVDLGLYRMHARKRSDSEVISLNAIIRGALVVKDEGCQFDDEYYVLDTVDCDLFERVKYLFAERYPLQPMY